MLAIIVSSFLSLSLSVGPLWSTAGPHPCSHGDFAGDGSWGTPGMPPPAMPPPGLLGWPGPGPTPPTLPTGRAGRFTFLVLQQGQGHGHILGASDQGRTDHGAGHADESRNEN